MHQNHWFPNSLNETYLTRVKVYMTVIFCQITFSSMIGALDISFCPQKQRGGEYSGTRPDIISLLSHKYTYH